MSSFIDDVIGTPRRRSKTPARSPLSTPPLRRVTSPDIFHSALAVPTRASLAGEKSPAAGISDSVAEAPVSMTTDSKEATEVAQPAELSTTGAEGDGTERNQDPEAVEKEGSEPIIQEAGIPESETTLHVVQETVPVVHTPPAILIGIAGCTCSGKSVLSYLLSSILPPASPTFVLHQDDFMVPPQLLVPSENGELDANCPEAVDFASLTRMLRFVKREGMVTAGFATKSDESDVQERAASMVSQGTLDELKVLLAESGKVGEGQPVGIVDGFLLFHRPEIRDLLDVKLFLRTTKEKAGARRFEKAENVGEDAGEVFWRTREYFEKTVWPNYVQEHWAMFRDGNVEGEPLFDVCDALAISVQPELDMSIEETVRWVVNCTVERLGALSMGQLRSLDPEEVLGDRYQLCECGHGWLGKVRRFLCEHV